MVRSPATSCRRGLTHADSAVRMATAHLLARPLIMRNVDAAAPGGPTTTAARTSPSTTSRSTPRRSPSRCSRTRRCAFWPNRRGSPPSTAGAPVSSMGSYRPTTCAPTSTTSPTRPFAVRSKCCWPRTCWGGSTGSSRAPTATGRSPTTRSTRSASTRAPGTGCLTRRSRPRCVRGWGRRSRRPTAPPQFLHHPIAPHPGLGQVTIALYIPSHRAGMMEWNWAHSTGNGRGPDPGPPQRLEGLGGRRLRDGPRQRPDQPELQRQRCQTDCQNPLPTTTDFGDVGYLFQRIPLVVDDSNRVRVVDGERTKVQFGIINSDKRLVAPRSTPRSTSPPTTTGR